MQEATCEICQYANKHAWWGPKLAPARSHCRKCCRSWASLNEGHCASCCRQFVNTKSFDAHLTEEACQDPAGIMRRDGKPKFIARDRHYGAVWAVADYRDRDRRPFND